MSASREKSSGSRSEPLPGLAPTTIANKIQSRSIPNFILNGYRVDNFLLSIKKRLSTYKTFRLNDRYTYEFKNALHSLQFCINSVTQLYRTMSSIMLNYDSNISPIDISKKENNQFYIDHDLLVLRAKDFFRTFEDKQNILVESQFINNVNDIKTSLITFYDSLDRCSYAIFTNFVSRNSSLTSHLKKNLTQERNVEFPGTKFLEFLYFKNWIYDNTFEAFEDIIDVSKLNYSVGFDKSQLMPGVFYEYFLFHDVEIGSKIFFHHKRNCSTLDAKATNEDPNIMDCFEMKNINNTTESFKYIRSVNNDEQVNYYFVCNEKPIEIFPNFVFQSKSNNSLSFYIYSNDTINSVASTEGTNVENTQNQKNCAIFHPKTLGSISKGFWISFLNSDKKYYCKELFCVSEKYDYYCSHHSTSSETFSDINITIQRSPDEATKSVENQNSTTNFTIINSYLYSRLQNRKPSPNRFHYNEYVELSGYLLLEYFGMIPKVDCFFSYLYGKPMVMIEGIDENEYTLLSNYVNDQKIRYDFNNIYNDKYAIFMSSIQLQKLRCMQVIFKLDDFHPANLAASITKEELLNNISVEFLNKIQAIDIWPTRRIVDSLYLFTKIDLSSSINACLFDEVIFQRLDYTHWDNEIYIQNEKGLIIPQDVVQNPDYSSIKREFEQRKQIINSMSLESLKELYGERIISIQDKSENHRILITFYAINDMFYDALKKDPLLFNELSEQNNYICKSMIVTMLKRNYIKINRDLEVLPEIPNFDIEPINIKNIKSISIRENDFFRYMESSLDIMESIYSKMREIICNKNNPPLKIVMPEVYQLKFVDVEGKLFGKEYKIIKVNNIWEILFRSETYLGIAFSTDNKDITKNLRHFNFKPDANEQLSFIKKNFSHDPGFYFICSPFSYDLIKIYIDFRYDRTEFKNVYKYG